MVCLTIHGQEDKTFQTSESYRDQNKPINIPQEPLTAQDLIEEARKAREGHGG